MPKTKTHSQKRGILLKTTSTHPSIPSCSLSLVFVHDQLISVLGALFLLFEFSCGAVPLAPTAGEAVAETEVAEVLELLRSLTPASLLEGADCVACCTSSLRVGAAIEDLDVRSIDVRGKRLLLEELLMSSALGVRRGMGFGPSRLLGR